MHKYKDPYRSRCSPGGSPGEGQLLMPLYVKGEHLTQSYFSLGARQRAPRDPDMRELGKNGTTVGYSDFDPARAARVQELCTKYNMPAEGGWRRILCVSEGDAQ